MLVSLSVIIDLALFIIIERARLAQGRLPKELGQLEQLQELFLAENQLSGELPKASSGRKTNLFTDLWIIGHRHPNPTLDVTRNFNGRNTGTHKTQREWR